MNRSILLLVVLLTQLIFVNCSDSEVDLADDAIGTWKGEFWAFRQTFGQNLINNQSGEFDGELQLNKDLSFSFTESNSIVDDIFESFEFPKSGTYVVTGSETFGNILFTTSTSDQVPMLLFRTDSSLTFTYREEVMRNGGVNDIEIDLFFVEAN